MRMSHKTRKRLSDLGFNGEECLLDYIQDRYWSKGWHLKAVEQELYGESRSGGSTILRTMQCHGIPRRPRGVWGKGMTKETHPLYRRHSERMSSENPMSKKGVPEARAITMAPHYADRANKAELDFQERLDALGVAFEFQYPIGRYVMDFAFPEVRKVVELDGRNHYRLDYKVRDIERDAYLRGEGYEVLRLPVYRYRGTVTEPAFRKALKFLGVEVRAE